MQRENSYLSDHQINSIKEKLLSEKEKIALTVKSQDNFCLDQNELSDPLDEASVNIQASQELRFRNREVFYLKKINKSLQRMDNGLYGLCENCEGEIGYDRLLARPTAELCISCKEEAELSEKNNFFEKKSKSLGKTISELGRL